jgi:hypothetical protein
VKTLSNKYIQLEVYMNDSIEAVKGQIQGKEGIPSYELRLMFQGKLLTNGTVSENAITKESVLTILQPPLKVVLRRNDRSATVTARRQSCGSFGKRSQRA